MWKPRCLGNALFCALAALVAVPAANGQTTLPLVLNEFLADNGSGLVDENGERQDWIEIYNPNGFAVSAAGWQLADSSRTWVFPEVMLGAGEFLVVFASGQNRRVPGQPLHTNFSLSEEGEYLALKRPDGVIVSAFAPGFSAQRVDVSAGRNVHGTPVVYETPTPGAANGKAAYGFVANVAVSVERGFFSGPQRIRLTCPTPGVTIRYTTDRSTPTKTRGRIYTGPIEVKSTTVLRVRAFKPGFLPSITNTQTYLFPDDIRRQIYAPDKSPAGWPMPGAAKLNGQLMRYGLQAAIVGEFTPEQFDEALRQIPSISLVTDQANLTGKTSGIYSNAMERGEAWERPASVEFFPEDGTGGFHVDCGLRIRGGTSRLDRFPKHSFRLYFRKKYGAGELTYPLHGEDEVSEFQRLDLRTEQNYSWANEPGTENTAVREVFCRDLAGAMGQPTTRSRYAHLFLNGQYWGLYMTEERVEEAYAASYFGGSDADYDVVKTSNGPDYVYEVENGTDDAWRTTWEMSRACAAEPTNANYFALLGCDASGVRVPSMPVFVDPEHLASYMLLFYYTGDSDAPLSEFLGMNAANNWVGVRRRSGEQGWQFVPHDCEHTLLAPDWSEERATAQTTVSPNRNNFSFANPEWIHEDLAANPEYRLKIADMAQRYFFHDGACTPERALALFDARAAQISMAILADAARWGTSAFEHRPLQWRVRLAHIRANFFPHRHTAVLGHLRMRGFYPGVMPPEFSQRGGLVPEGYALTLSSGTQTGAIFYTLDGSDPRAVGGAALGTEYAGALIIEDAVTVRVRFRSDEGEWSALDEVTFSTAAAPPASAENLVVSKVHYHPTDPTDAEVTAGFDEDGDFEYLELLNISAEPVDLRGVVINAGVTFSFGEGAIKTLPAGERVLVVANRAAFALRFGGGLPVAGHFDGSLSNGGELLRVVDGEGAIIAQFTYDDVAPWATSPDGGGPALVLVEPGSRPDPNAGANWRASNVNGGAPGEED